MVIMEAANNLILKSTVILTNGRGKRWKGFFDQKITFSPLPYYLYKKGGYMRKSILMVIVLLHFFCGGSLTTPWLNDNVKIEKVSAVSPAKNQVVVSVTVSNKNNFRGKITVGTDVNCGTVTWREKKKDVVIESNSKATIEIKFEGIRDMIPTVVEKAEIQTRLYDSHGREIEESGKFIIHRKYGYKD